MVVSLLSLVLGSFAGMAWVTGYTLLGLEVEDAVRGRTFAFVQNAVQLTLIGVLAAGPFIAGSIGSYSFGLGDSITVSYNGAAAAMVLAGLLALVVGIVTYRTMDDRRGVPLLRDLVDAMRGEPGHRRSTRGSGLFVAFEGGEGAGKSTQAQLLADVAARARPRRRAHPRAWRHADRHGTACAAARPPRATTRRRAPRRCSTPRTGPSTSTPWSGRRWSRGADVITDRYLDSSIAYQAAGRELGADEVARLSAWATRGLRPDLTVLLDVAPTTGLSRFDHRARPAGERVAGVPRARTGGVPRAGAAGPDRYLVLDASQSVDELHLQIRERLGPVLRQGRGGGDGQPLARRSEDGDSAARPTSPASPAARSRRGLGRRRGGRDRPARWPRQPSRTRLADATGGPTAPPTDESAA